MSPPARRLCGLALWAARDLLRRPFESGLVAASLAAAVAVPAIPLLLAGSLRATAERVLAEAPSVVVRRVEGGGFAPVPRESAEVLRAVAGVRRAAARTWGVVTSPAGPVTVSGLDTGSAAFLSAERLPAPGPGRAVVGPGVAADGELVLGAAARRFVVAGRLPERAGLVAQDTVLLTEDDAATLLGLAPGLASDVAVWVGHEAEETAMQRDLAAALPWPVRFTTRREALGAQLAGLSRLSGTSLLATAPAVLAVLVLVAGAVRDRFGSRREAGLLKALGWTSGDVAAFSLVRSLVVALPSASAGAALAALAVFWPGPFWAGRHWLGWKGTPPALALDAGSALLALLPVVAWVIVPWLLASVLAALGAATADPAELLSEEEG